MSKNTDVKLISMDTIPIEEVTWLLKPFIPYGKITIIQGDPGEGKTTLVLQIIAALTTGRPIWDGLPETERNVFLCRYWYMDSIEAIGKMTGFSQSKVTSMLHRTRGKLRKVLTEEGYV